MLGKRLNPKVCRVMHRKSCTHLGEAGQLPNPSFQWSRALARRSIPETATSQYTPFFSGCDNVLCDGRPVMNWLKETKGHLPVLDTSDVRKYGIAYESRGLWRRSFHSTQMLRVMSQTWGRETGSIIVDGVVREMRNAYLYEAMRNWRAGCIERCKPWFGEGRTEKVCLCRTSLAVYSTSGRF